MLSIGGGVESAIGVETLARSRVIDEAGVSVLLGHEWFFEMDLEITGGNADVCENR
jgi:hypothetical protein